MKKHILTKDGRYVFIDIDAYQRGQVSEEICATNSWEKLTSLRLTDKFKGGTEDFINQWDEGI